MPHKSGYAASFGILWEGISMTIKKHPAQGPVSLDRLHQIHGILSKAAGVEMLQNPQQNTKKLSCIINLAFLL